MANPIFETIFWSSALALLMYKLFLLARYLYRTVPFLSLNLNLRYNGESGRRSWAVVTGASDGLGKEFCLLLAERGFDIVLVSRTESKLMVVEEAIKAQSPTVQTKVVVLDLSKATYQQIVSDLSSQLSGLDVSILVNNAGVSHPARYIHEYDEELDLKALETIQVNVIAFSAVARAVIPLIANRSKSSVCRGAIINVSSASGKFGIPIVDFYGGSKGFNRSFSLSLETAYQDYNIDVLTLMPFFTVTNMVKAKESFLIPSASSTVRAALSVLGRKSETFGTFSHEIQKFLCEILPETMSKMSLKFVLAARSKDLKKNKSS